MKNKKILIPALLVAAIVIIAIVVITFGKGGGDLTESVTLEITCEDILDNYAQLDEALKDEKYVPSDGVILAETEVKIAEGESVFDALKRACEENDIQLEYENSSMGAYIKGLNYIYEFSCGTMGGWLYSVNGESASVGCSEYELKDGDKVSWYYTCDIMSSFEENT